MEWERGRGTSADDLWQALLAERQLHCAGRQRMLTFLHVPEFEMEALRGRAVLSR